MWFLAPGKLAVNGGFGNVGVPPTRTRTGLLGRPFHPITALPGGHRAVRGGPQGGRIGARAEDLA